MFGLVWFGYLHKLIVTSAIALKLLIWVNSAVLAQIFLHKHILTYFQGVLVELPMTRFNGVPGGIEHVVENFSGTGKAASLNLHLDHSQVPPCAVEEQGLDALLHHLGVV